jgi:hypothetical protein
VLPPDRLDQGDSLLERKGRDVAPVDLRGFSKALGDAEHSLHEVEHSALPQPPLRTRPTDRAYLPAGGRPQILLDDAAGLNADSRGPG